MTLAQLEVLITLDECRSFSRAAMRLGTTQSAVSHALRALETQFGVKLAQRDASGVTMTDAGERLLLRAREMTALAATMTQELGDAKELKTGTLRIGSFGPTSTVNLLPPLLAAFKKRHPGAQVRIEEESDEVIDGWLLQKRVELGFVVVPDERFEVLPLVQDEFVAILPAGHPLAKHKAVPVSALTGLDFVLTEAGCGPVIVPILQKPRTAQGAVPLHADHLHPAVCAAGAGGVGRGPPGFARCTAGCGLPATAADTAAHGGAGLPGHGQALAAGACLLGAGA